VRTWASWVQRALGRVQASKAAARAASDMGGGSGDVTLSDLTTNGFAARSLTGIVPDAG
jgi:hypothetical protein